MKNGHYWIGVSVGVFFGFWLRGMTPDALAVPLWIAFFLAPIPVSLFATRKPAKP